MGSVLGVDAMNHYQLYSLRNRTRKLIFGQNVHSYKAKKVTRAIFDILKISIMAAIFMSKTAILDIKMAAIMEIFKISKIALVTFFAL